MVRSFDEEILDKGGLPAQEVARAHRGLLLTHTLLGNHRAILQALKSDEQPVRRILDIGCGDGALLEKIRGELQADVVGVDVQPPEQGGNPVPVLKLDAVRGALPDADVAVCVCMVHHLHDEEVIELIANVGRSCRRFIVLDLVRQPVPLALFRTFAPLCLPRVNVLDGAQSIRRAYTPDEFRVLIARALRGTGGKFRHSVAPLWIRQVADIRY